MDYNSKYDIRRDIQLIESSLSHANLFSEEAKKEIEAFSKLTKVSPHRAKRAKSKQNKLNSATRAKVDDTDNIFKAVYATTLPTDEPRAGVLA